VTTSVTAPTLRVARHSARCKGLIPNFGADPCPLGRSVPNRVTVVRALHHLPKDHHLLIFGGAHPNEIKPHQAIDPVVSSLFDAGYVDTGVAERIKADAGAAPAVSGAVDGSMRDLLIERTKDLSDRIHLMGAQSDTDFLKGWQFER
jgi:hypothetical protein